MPIFRLLRDNPVAVENAEALVAAYEETLRALSLVDRTDPITELVARKIIEIGQTGILDPSEISRLAVKALTNWLGPLPKGAAL